MQSSGSTHWVFWAGAAIVGVGSGIFLNDRGLERRTYWLSWLAGGLVMTLAARMQNPDRALGIASFSDTTCGTTFPDHMYLRLEVLM